MNYLELHVDDLAEDLVGHLEHLDLVGQQRRVRRLLQLQGTAQQQQGTREQFRKGRREFQKDSCQERGARLRSDLLQVTLEEVEDPLIGLGQLHERPRAGAPQLREQLRVPSCSRRQTDKQTNSRRAFSLRPRT